jgi:hypothetical protein
LGGRETSASEVQGGEAAGISISSG